MEHQFKPFDQVLVRNSDKDTWLINHYGYFSSTVEGCKIYICTSGSCFRQCIPYNENTKHLVGTTEPYEQPKPKTYHVEWGLDSQMEQQDYTDEEFESFIKIAVLRNKDISNFKVTRICG